MKPHSVNVTLDRSGPGTRCQYLRAKWRRSQPSKLTGTSEKRKRKTWNARCHRSWKKRRFWNEKGSLEKGVMLRSSKMRMKTPSFDLASWTWRKLLKKSARVDVETWGPWEVGLESVGEWVGWEETDTYLLHHWPRHWFNLVLNKHYVRDNTALGKRWRISFLLLSGSSQSKWGDKQASTFFFPLSSQNILKQALFSGVVTIYVSQSFSFLFMSRHT